MSVGCSELYPCHRWDCNRCLSKKVYWLREQAVQFALELSTIDTYFYTLKGFKTAQDAKLEITKHLAMARAQKSRYNAKLEYFFVISNHDYSGWHVHMIANLKLDLDAAYCKPCEDVKWSALYLVKNLLRSAAQDYGGVRRYGGSSLLNKQNMKRRFINRKRSWAIRTRFHILKLIVKIIITAHSSSQPTDNRQPTAKPITPDSSNPETELLQTIRPPP